MLSSTVSGMLVGDSKSFVNDDGSITLLATIAYKRRDKDDNSNSNLIDVSIRTKSDSKMGNYLKKGAIISVIGEPGIRKFQSNNKTYVRIRIKSWGNNVDILKFPETSSTSANSTSTELDDDPILPNDSTEEENEDMI